MIKFFILGRLPPPIGGATIHTKRLLNWLRKKSNFHVNSVNITCYQLVIYIFKSIWYRKNKIITHCQTSSVYGLLFVVLSKFIFKTKNKIVYTIHSEFWVDKNIKKQKSIFKVKIALFCLKNTDLTICVNNNIFHQVRQYSNKVKVLIPFLPPDGKATTLTLDKYLGLPPFDSNILVFNAYKLSYDNNGCDIYGLDTLLKAFLYIEIPLTLLLLIPQITHNEKNKINLIVNKSNNLINESRIHIISKNNINGWKVIEKSDIFIRPTITDGDALSLRESLFFGIPAIASDCTNRPEGTIIFKTGDANDLKQKILNVLSTPISKKVNKQETGMSIIDKYIDSYEALFDHSGAGK